MKSAEIAYITSLGMGARTQGTDEMSFVLPIKVTTRNILGTIRDPGW